MMEYKYQVGDLVTTGLNLYLVEEIKHHRYYVRQTGSTYQFWWEITSADGDRHLKKVN